MVVIVIMEDLLNILLIFFFNNSIEYSAHLSGLLVRDFCETLHVNRIDI